MVFHQHGHFGIEQSRQKLIAHLDKGHLQSPCFEGLRHLQADQAAAQNTGALARNSPFLQQYRVFYRFDGKDIVEIDIIQGRDNGGNSPWRVRSSGSTSA